MHAGCVLTVAMCLGAAGAAQAFEVDGFRSGMPIEEALKVARQKGYVYKDEPHRGLDYMSYGSTNAGPGLVYADGKLCIVGSFTTGDLHRFIELVNQRASLFGPPAYTVHEEIMGNGNKFSQLAAKWRLNSDYTHAIISKIGTGRDNISDQYRDLAICPEK